MCHEHHLEGLFSAPALKQLAEITQKLSLAHDICYRYLIEIEQELFQRLDAIHKLTPPPSETVIQMLFEELTIVAEDLWKRHTSPLPQPPALKEYLAQFQDAVHNLDHKTACPLSREIRCEIVYLIALDSLNFTVLQASVDALRVGVERLRSACAGTDDEFTLRYISNIQIRLDALELLDPRYFSAQKPGRSAWPPPVWGRLFAPSAQGGQMTERDPSVKNLEWLLEHEVDLSRDFCGNFLIIKDCQIYAVCERLEDVKLRLQGGGCRFQDFHSLRSRHPSPENLNAAFQVYYLVDMGA